MDAPCTHSNGISVFMVSIVKYIISIGVCSLISYFPDYTDSAALLPGQFGLIDEGVTS